MLSRRRFIGCALGASLAHPFGAVAQPAKVRRIGLLLPGAAAGVSRMGGFLQELRALGYVEGENLHIERRFSENQDDRLPALAAELVKLDVEVLVAAGPTAATAAASVTRTVPIVMGTHDPVEQGLVKSLARPGGNVTGWCVLSADSAAKQVSILKEAIPHLRRVAVLVNPGMGGHAARIANVTEAVRSAQLQPIVVEVPNGEAVAPAFATLRRERAEAFFVIAEPAMDRLSELFARTAAQQKVPGMYSWKLYVQAGGLMSYGPSLPAMIRRWAPYVDRILKGAKPADLPVETPREFELVLNQRAARELGFTFPAPLLVTAAEVIS